MDEPGGLHLKRRLRCELEGRLLEWHSWTFLAGRAGPAQHAG